MELHDRLFGSTPGDDDDTRWAASGAMALTGAPDGPPALPPRSLVPVVNAAAVAIATSSRALGRTVELDALALLGERAAIASFSRHGRRSAGGSTELHRCADGWLAVTLARSDDVELLPAWLGTTDVAVGVGERTAADLVGAAAELGLPCGSLGEVAAEQPAFVTHAGPGAQPHDSLAGVVVVDLSSLWAGPLCARLLGDAGARVVKVESTRRPDGARRGPPAFYDLLHGGHESVALDFADPVHIGALRRLIGRADVVIEASRPRALAQLGVDAAERAGAGGVWLSITGYGRSGAGSGRVAFGDDAAIAGGLVAGASDAPWFCADAVADPLAGMVGAAVVLDLLARGASGLVDLAMSRVAAWCARTPPSREPWTGPVAPPRARTATTPGRALGADTADVLAELAG